MTYFKLSFYFSSNDLKEYLLHGRPIIIMENFTCDTCEMLHEIHSMYKLDGVGPVDKRPSTD